MAPRRSSESSPLQKNGEWLARLNRLSPAVDTWHKRSKNPQPPDPGSSLAADSMAGLNVDNPVWYSMCVSSEHLHFSLEAMRATGTLYPTAYITVARTALVAAVNAVWVLAPRTRQERRERALTLRAEDLRSQITAIGNLPAVDSESEEVQQKLLEQLRERQSGLQATAVALGIERDVENLRLNQTEAIKWVARSVPDLDDDLLASGVQAIWRSGSAAAHAQYHYGVMRAAKDETVPEQSGSSIVRLSGDLDKDIGPALAAAAMVLNEAFRLFDLRRVAHLS